MFDLLSFSENEAVISDSGIVLSYSQLYEETQHLKSHIPKRGLICCLCTNTIGSLVGYISGFYAQSPLILLDGERDNNYIKSYLDKYYPEYIWVPSNKKSYFLGTIIYESYDYSLIQMDYGDNCPPPFLK